MIHIGATDRLLAVGMTGSGKTHRIWELLTDVPRFAVIDEKHSQAYERPGFPINARFNERDTKQIIRVPTGTQRETEHEIDRAIHEAWAHGNMTLVIDEITLVNEQVRLRAAFSRAVKTGRERGLRVFLGTQRPAEIPRACISEVEHYLIFVLTDPDDRKRMEQRIGPEAAALMPIDKSGEGGDCLYFHVPTRTHALIPRAAVLGKGPAPPKPRTVHEKMNARNFREGSR